MNWLLDTNTCIYFMKNQFPKLTSRILGYPVSSFSLSSITVFELEYGTEKSRWSERTRQQLALFLAPFEILPFTAEDSLIAGRIRGTLERKGQLIGPYDILIAAQALSRGLTVITHNTGEFERVSGLHVEDWII